MALVTRQGAGASLTQAQGDTNWDTLNGINEAQTGTTHTIDHTDELKTIEYSNASPIAVTLTAISTIDSSNDSQISDFKVTLKNIGAGLVTVTRGSTDTFEGGVTSITISQYESVTIQSDSTGAIWNIIQKTFGDKTLASTDDVIDNFPSGTAMLFYQAAAPTGWTGSDTNGDHAIQVVTETSATGGATGGSSDFSTVFGLTATDGYTLLEADIPPHTHQQRQLASTGSGTGGGGLFLGNINSGQFTASTGGGGIHAHDIDLQVKHIQVIVATKD